MKKIALGALLLSALFSASSQANAAGNAVSTAIQVSFVVREACTVQIADGAKAAPAVSCAYQAPVQVSAATSSLQAAPAQTLAAVDGGWQIYF